MQLKLLTAARWDMENRALREDVRLLKERLERMERLASPKTPAKTAA